MSCQIAHNIEDKIRTEDVQINENVDFTSMLLSDAILQGITANGFKKPSPIQLKAIPLGRCGYDLIIQAKSGTGKTVVFGIIALEMINVTKSELQVVILVPTREIAVQIKDVIQSIGMNLKGLNVEYFIGGTSTTEDHKKIKSCHVAVGTPGRVKQLIKSGNMKVDSVRLFVLDEADKLLSDGHQKVINFIFNNLDSNKQMIASSATYPGNLKNFLTKYMHSPTIITPNESVPVLLGIRQFITTVKSHLNVLQQMTLKLEEVIRILQSISFSQCIIFSNYQTRAETLSNNLISKGWPTVYISGAQNQKSRLAAMANLKEFKCRIVSTTDLTARGIDAANVDLVINYEVPGDCETYLHRMGRAGRFGSNGICISIVAEGTEEEKLKNLLSQIGNNLSNVVKLPKENIPQNIWTCDLENFEKMYSSNTKLICNNQLENSVEKTSNEDKINKDKCVELVSENIQQENNLDTENKIELLLQSIKKEDEIENETCRSQFNNMTPANIIKMLSEGQSTSKIPDKSTEKIKKNEEEDKIKNSDNLVTASNLNSQTEETVNRNTISEENDDKIKKSKRKKLKKNINKENVDNSVILNEDNNEQFENEAKLFQQNNILHKNIALYNITKLMTEQESGMSDGITGTEKLLEIIEYEDKLEIKQQKDKLHLTDILNQLGLKTNKFCTCSENLFCDVFNYAVSKTDIDWRNNLCQFHDKEDEAIPEEENYEETEEYVEETEEYYANEEYNYNEETEQNQEYVEEVVYDEQIFTKGCNYALNAVANYDNAVINTEDNNVCGYATVYCYDHLKSEKKTNKRKHSKPVQEDMSTNGSEESSTFESYYDYYDNLLAQYGPYFTDTNEFEKWFKQWQENVYSVRNYIQESVFTKERLPKPESNS